MKSTRAPFMPVSPDIDDQRLERLAEEKGVGTLVKASANANRGGEAAPIVAAPATQTVQSEPESGVAETADAPTPRSQMKALNLELPVSVWTELKIRAAHKQTSVRHIVMCALREQGIAIAEVDMVEDGRRLR